ncbi:hypothetical protein ILUMI_20711 [Ignelater luminosus]|uniref:HAT C-terminal dimerisation domain-containing protein n=1 Tax=Ignelater luminosus TaxID=2038154 RepID=A0A8K0CHW2_IGNLU|nr:hypothetical protein ILUMI_20711 [Ignelater luminosus]
MANHLATCKKCPDIIKNEIKKEQRQWNNKNETILSCSSSVSTAATDLLSPISQSVVNNNLLNSSSTPTSKSSVLLSKFVDCTTADETDEIWTENKYWINFFKRIRPSLQLPSRHNLSSTLLQNNVQLQVQNSLANAYVVGIQCDGWSNIRNDSIINFIVTTPQPVFYKTVSTEEHRHMGQYVAEQIEAVFTDIVNDITKLNTTDILINSAKAIIKVIKSKSVLTSAFFNLQREKQEPRKCVLKLPVATRWASTVLSFESLLKNRNILKALAINDEYQNLIEKRNKTNILDDDIFWKRIESFLKILQPLKKWITVLESDECRINEVTEALIEIEKVFNKELPLSDLSSSKQDKILEAVQARKKMCLKPIHFSANILDPKLKGKHLSAGEIVQGLQYIHSLARHLSNVDENKVLENLADFRSNSGFWEMQFVQDSAINPNISPVTFWKRICTEFPLRFVAETVLTMPATSAATERSFSSYGNIHTKKRNRLSVKRAGMLIYVNHNLKLFSATADKIKIVTNNDKSLNFFGYKANDELSGDPTDTSESTVTLGLEEKTMAANQSEPGFSGWYSPRCVDQSSSSEDSKLYKKMDAVLYASDELEDEDHVDKDEDID